MADFLSAMVVIDLILRMIGLVIYIVVMVAVIVKVAKEARKGKEIRRKLGADGPEENGWGFCPGCGRLIAAEDVTDLSDAPAEIKRQIIENHEKLTAAEAGNG